MSASTGRRSMCDFLLFRWRDPEAGLFQQLPDQRDEALEGHVDRRLADNKDEIPAASDVRIDEANGLANPALGAVAIVCFAKLFPDDETAACSAGTVARRIQAEPVLRPGLSFPLHAAKLL
jgi:hypothetical protein